MVMKVFLEISLQSMRFVDSTIGAVIIGLLFNQEISVMVMKVFLEISLQSMRFVDSTIGAVIIGLLFN